MMDSSTRKDKIKKDKIRILFFIDQIDAPTGGTEQHLSFLINNLPTERYELHLCLVRDGGWYDTSVYPVKPKCLDLPSLRSPFGLARAVQLLTRIISENEIDIVSTYFPDSEILACISAQLVKSCVVVANRRNMGHSHVSGNLWRTRITNHLVNHFIANSEAVKARISGLEWVPQDKIVVIPNPLHKRRIIDGSEHPISKEEIGIKQNDYVVGIVANVTPVKDHQTFLKAARIVHDQIPNAKFLVVGKIFPNNREKLQSYITSLGLSSSVLLLGEFDNPIPLMRLFDVGVLSSKSEGLSNSLIEYAAVGIPTIATNVGGNPEVVIDGYTGFLVPPSAAESMGNRIIRLLENKELRSSFGCNANNHIRSLFDQDKIISLYEQFYRKVVM